MLDEPVERIPGKTSLHLHEAGIRVALVGDEEEAGIEAAETVSAVHEAVSTPQHGRA
mgnify:CR=1 FL=1